MDKEKWSIVMVEFMKANGSRENPIAKPKPKDQCILQWIDLVTTKMTLVCKGEQLWLINDRFYILHVLISFLFSQLVFLITDNAS